VDLGTRIGKLELRNPVCLASGTCGFGGELEDFLDLRRLGGLFTKALTLEPRAGNPMPRLAETEHGLLNSIGLANPGLEVFLDELLPPLRELEIPVLVNVAGRSAADYVELARALAECRGPAGIELNVSCPNVKEGGIAFGASPGPLSKLLRQVREAWPGLLLVKMTPQVSSVAEMARLAEDCGADGLSLINTIPGMAIDPLSRRPRTVTNTSGYSGPALKPVALAQVYQAARAVRIPVVGVGGIQTAEDVVEFLLAGACAVQVGTASFRDPGIAGRILDDLARWGTEQGVSLLSELVGAVRPW